MSQLAQQVMQSAGGVGNAGHNDDNFLYHVDVCSIDTQGAADMLRKHGEVIGGIVMDQGMFRCPQI